MSISKRHLKSKPVCKVTFKLPKEAVNGAESVYVVGDFNNWNYQANPMNRLKNGTFSLTLDLDQGKEYQFRYLIDLKTWENDWNADRYVPSPYSGSENSVVSV